MRESVFNKMRLVGGTALALQIGHRRSIDIDLFGELDINSRELQLTVKKFGSVTPLQDSEHIHVYLIDEVKVDLVNYNYEWLKPCVRQGAWRLAALEDIAAMKLSAITGRGSKKDFIDIYFLLQHFDLKHIMEYYQQKYQDGSSFLVLKSLNYFEDAEHDEMPEMIKDVEWPVVKDTILMAAELYVKENG